MAIHESEMYSAHVCYDNKNSDWVIVLVTWLGSDPVWVSKQEVNINKPVEVKFTGDYLVI